jgi:hypothetical protein
MKDEGGKVNCRLRLSFTAPCQSFALGNPDLINNVTQRSQTTRRGAQGVELSQAAFQGVAMLTTGLKRTEAPSRLARTRTRGLTEERELEA